VTTITLTSDHGSITLYAENQGRDGFYQAGQQFFQDWYSISDSKTEIRERPSAPGAFGIDRDWRSALPLNLNGRFRGPNWATMLRDLRATLSGGLPLRVTVSDDLGVSSRMVSVRRFVPAPNPGALLADFQVVLTATDPLMYGPQQSASTAPPSGGTGQPWPQVWPADWGTAGNPGRVSAANGGAEATPLLLTVAGGVDGVELVEVTTGSTLRLERVIPAGSVAVFDAALTRAYLDTPANDITGFMTRREWSGFLIAARSTAIVQFNPLGTQVGSPLLTVTWADAN